jgi:hypothetical protein
MRHQAEQMESLGVLGSFLKNLPTKSASLIQHALLMATRRYLIIVIQSHLDKLDIFSSVPFVNIPMTSS